MCHISAMVLAKATVCVSMK